jgi:ABC-2 type transport system ATP-binding protein
MINPDVTPAVDLWVARDEVIDPQDLITDLDGLGPPAIAAEGLTKRFGSKLAVDDVTLAVAPGEVFGFLGPNGAGKTTTIKMLVGLLKPSAGRAHIGGFDVHTESLPAKARIGYAPDQPLLPDKLTPHEYLDYVAGLYQLPRAAARIRGDELLAAFDLAERADDLIEGFSHGMKQKTALTGALLHGPAALFLDEPTVGLDPKSARLIKDLLRRLADQGMAVFMSTHILEIAERMCDRVGIIQGGRLIAAGTLAELRAGRTAGESLEDIFLQLTGDPEEGAVVAELTDSDAAPP